MIELNGDIDRANSQLEPYVTRLLGLLQMWHMFKVAVTVSEDFVLRWDDLSYPLKIACTKSVVIDYTKPWSGNFSPEINSLKAGGKKNWSYPFLTDVVARNEHEQLLELRNKIVAHLDEGYEGGRVLLRGLQVRNDPEGRPRQAETLESVFLPAVAAVTGLRGVWWISKKEKVEQLKEHIEVALGKVQEEIRSTAQEFRICCFDHMHVLEQLSQTFSTAQIETADGHAEVKPFGEVPVPVVGSNTVDLKIGEINVTSLVSVYEPMPSYPSDVVIRGNGYVLTIGAQVDGEPLSFNVSFPKYNNSKGV